MDWANGLAATYNFVENFLDFGHDLLDFSSDWKNLHGIESGYLKLPHYFELARCIGLMIYRVTIAHSLYKDSLVIISRLYAIIL